MLLYSIYLDLLSHGFHIPGIFDFTSACFWESLTTTTYFPTCNIFVLFSDSQKDHESIAGRHEHCEAFCSFDGHGLRTFKLAGCLHSEALRWAVKKTSAEKDAWIFGKPAGFRNDEMEWWKSLPKSCRKVGSVFMELASLHEKHISSGKASQKWVRGSIETKLALSTD